MPRFWKVGRTASGASPAPRGSRPLPASVTSVSKAKPATVRPVAASSAMPKLAAGAQSIDELGLSLALERRLDDAPDRRGVGGALLADLYRARCVHHHPSRTRPIAIATAACVGSTTGRPAACSTRSRYCAMPAQPITTAFAPSIVPQLLRDAGHPLERLRLIGELDHVQTRPRARPRTGRRAPSRRSRAGDAGSNPGG